ncbi:MAG: glycosyltransferase family 4 protein, partial [bacterium]|nr:glycosyltransferase family 4 protein [bacterium]
CRGHEVVFVPMYTPLPVHMGEAIGRPSPGDRRLFYGDRRLFYGGINVYLQQKFKLFRHTPRFVDKLFDHPALIDFVSRFGHLTQASDLADLTVSVMKGEAGNQRKELEALLEWHRGQPRPDAVILPTSLLAGLAAPLRDSLGAPVLCLLSGEDAFIDQFPEPHRTRTLEILRGCARDIDGFMAANRYYAAFMTDYLALPPGKVRLMTAGIDVEAYAGEAAPRSGLFTIGYRSQICPLNGLHVLAEALRILRSRPETAACRVRAAGHVAPGDRRYLADIRRRIRAWGLADNFEYVGELGPADRPGFLKALDAFTVPAIYPEPIGLYVPEALAAGVPVVLPRTGCLPEWVSATGGGLLIEQAHPEELAAALAGLMKDRALARRLGEAGRARIHAAHTLRHMADSILEAIGDCRARIASRDSESRADQ